jgi:hypothetical protein
VFGSTPLQKKTLHSTFLQLHFTESKNIWSWYSCLANYTAPAPEAQEVIVNSLFYPLLTGNAALIVCTYIFQWCYNIENHDLSILVVPFVAPKMCCVAVVFPESGLVKHHIIISVCVIFDSKSEGWSNWNVCVVNLSDEVAVQMFVTSQLVWMVWSDQTWVENGQAQMMSLRFSADNTLVVRGALVPVGRGIRSLISNRD